MLHSIVCVMRYAYLSPRDGCVATHVMLGPHSLADNLVLRFLITQMPEFPQHTCITSYCMGPPSKAMHLIRTAITWGKALDPSAHMREMARGKLWFSNGLALNKRRLETSNGLYLSDKVKVSLTSRSLWSLCSALQFKALALL